MTQHPMMTPAAPAPVSTTPKQSYYVPHSHSHDGHHSHSHDDHHSHDTMESTDMTSTDMASTDMASTDMASTDMASTDMASTDMMSSEMTSADTTEPEKIGYHYHHKPDHTHGFIERNIYEAKDALKASIKEVKESIAAADFA